LFVLLFAIPTAAIYTNQSSFSNATDTHQSSATISAALHLDQSSLSTHTAAAVSRHRTFQNSTNTAALIRFKRTSAAVPFERSSSPPTTAAAVFYNHTFQSNANQSFNNATFVPWDSSSFLRCYTRKIPQNLDQSSIDVCDTRIRRTWY